MVNLIRSELLKLKRSKMIIISILGAMVTPIMVFVGVLKAKFTTADKIVTYADIFSESNLYIMLLFGVIVYTVIGSYLFSREYVEKTLKIILTVPVSRVTFIVVKFLMLLVWIIALTVITWVCSLFFAVLSRASEFSMLILKQSIIEYFWGGILLFLMISPFVFIAIYSKGVVVPIITAASVVMINIAVSNENLAALFPWTSSYLLVTGQIENTGYPMWLAIFLISLVSLSGFISSVIYFKKEDIV
ncbi:ABC transporter permease [Clostridium sp. D2Q-14]|uniref:ABC transporter permease n=1 Tax=Anaeromonas gelatinilytica TaxID=2683194 RepID=UPI00193B2E04|nr:ABC transporter permease [Anaeromonas gelatinilytica]MBS4536296.1 ABC transporter permease [Anaeromonas gelatinilytica]